MNLLRGPGRILLACCLMAPVLAGGAPDTHREITGKVIRVADNLVTVTRNLEFDPNPGDPAEIYFPALGVPAGVVVATGKVKSVGDTFVAVEIDRATGPIMTDYYVRVRSARPQPRVASRAPGTPTGVGVLEPFKAGRWMTVRQLTGLTDKDLGPIYSVRMSGDGSRIVFASLKGTYLVRADGSNFIQLGDKRNNGLADLTADGGKVAWYDENGLHFASNDGTSRPVLAKGLNVAALRLTAKGDRLFVLSRERGGIYSVPLDGSDLKQLVATAEVAKLDGSEPNNNHWGGSLDISEDGSCLVFQYRADAYALEAGGLRRLTEFARAKDFTLSRVALGGDGKHVALFKSTSPPRLIIQPRQGDRVSTYEGPQFGNRTLTQVTRDGKAVISGGLQLYAPDGTGWQDPGKLPDDNLALPGADMATINSDGTRACLRLGTKGTRLAVFDMNPTTIGPAPPLEDITVSGGFLTTDGTTEVTITARITRADIQHVGFLPMRDGRAAGPSAMALVERTSADLSDPRDGKVMTGTFRLTPGVKMPPGPITIRLAAVSKSGDALVVDVEGLEVKTP